jgi:hypothetical protein
MGNVTDLAWVVILWGFSRDVVLYWELSNWVVMRAGYVLLLMNGYLAKESQFGT